MKILLEKLIVTQAVKKFPAFYVTVVTTARHGPDVSSQADVS
jgi:hypothetical protein